MSLNAAHTPGSLYISDRIQVTDRSGVATKEFHKLQLALVQNVNTQPDVLAVSHAQRKALDVAIYPEGTLVFEVDRQVLYTLVGNSWNYVAGYMRNVRAAAPVDLTANDVGFLMNVTDFNHLVEWDGAMWQFGPGDNGNAYFQDFAALPSPIEGWTLCDGRGSSYLGPGVNLAIVPFITPDLVSTPAYRKSGAAYSGVVTGGGGTLTGGGASDPNHITTMTYFRR